MKTKLRPSAELAEILRPWCPWEMTRFLQYQAIDSAITSAATPLDGSLQSAAFAFDTEPGTVADDLAQRCDADAGQRLAALLAAKHVLDQCSELPTIRKKLQPLFDELHAARAAEALAEAAASHARQIVRDEAEQKRLALLADLAAEEERELAAVAAS